MVPLASFKLNFKITRIKCFLYFTRKILVNLCKSMEKDLVSKLNWRLNFYCGVPVVEKCLEIFLMLLTILNRVIFCRLRAPVRIDKRQLILINKHNYAIHVIYTVRTRCVWSATSPLSTFETLSRKQNVCRRKTKLADAFIELKRLLRNTPQQSGLGSLLRHNCVYV